MLALWLLLVVTLYFQVSLFQIHVQKHVVNVQFMVVQILPLIIIILMLIRMMDHVNILHVLMMILL